MRRDDVNDDLKELAFDFFFRFARFEFALKENGYLQDSSPGARAVPNWDCFVANWHQDYRASDHAARIIEAAPKRQVVGTHQNVEWKRVDLHGCQGDLGRVVRVLRTVRNNLFHGGKHGDRGWDDPIRTGTLLKLGITILDEIARHTDIEPDYTRMY